MSDDELTPWEQKERLEELKEELQARGLPSPSEAEWDDGSGKSQIVYAASAPYPPPYDTGRSVEPDVDGRGVYFADDG